MISKAVQHQCRTATTLHKKNNSHHIQGGSKKVSHYQVLSLNRIKKTVIGAKFFINFDYKISKRML